MELYAAGLNAWGQLYMNNSPQSSVENDTDDIYEFTCILRARTIEHVRAFLSYTAVICDSNAKSAGYFPTSHHILEKTDLQAYSTLAEASNGSVAFITSAGMVRQFSCLQDILNGEQGQTFSNLPACIQLVAYETGFVALSSSGNVYTWGDERYVACLGREVSDTSPADKPGLVISLQDLPTGPISKVAAGGYMLAALTAGNDLYLWGGHPGKKTIPADVTDEPIPVVIDDDDITDIAIGDSHLLVLTAGGRIFVIGENNNGQLGLAVESADSWNPVRLDLSEGTIITGVAAGPRNSFIIVKRGKTP